MTRWATSSPPGRQASALLRRLGRRADQDAFEVIAIDGRPCAVGSQGESKRRSIWSRPSPRATPRAGADKVTRSRRDRRHPGSARLMAIEGLSSPSTPWVASVTSRQIIAKKADYISRSKAQGSLREDVEPSPTSRNQGLVDPRSPPQTSTPITVARDAKYRSFTVDGCRRGRWPA